ncbi:hypothetical protein [Mycobacterium avium]|uniref:hypothetical protein n=1 Tax=Mycobacterium avium TaxID=1764 RepID=UPI0001B5A38D|nr:hypothetical protein [Mycobacterium avium]ETB09705.1 hypothetical protein O972_25305 [Mycobacterium avium subsp. avium 10-9275]ETB12479.1 hypothetical protein P863_06705 [Mycobacterium avium subsp. silvaticum ATCC 49884]ETB23025.1 hypothetical protein O973_05600 [Mycobacterium avium subsp. avium 11-4751]ANR92724.1 hypothetical protein BBJ32_16440 [Mycobacterium avium]AYJ05174.1 hypothetical protein DBO90_10450 [Mycobacterium avium]
MTTATSTDAIHASTGTAASFAEIIAESWDEPLRCQTKQTARPCRNPAAWIAQHCADRGTAVCTFHKNRYVRKTLILLATSPRLLLRCGKCKDSFPVEHFVDFRAV